MPLVTEKPHALCGGTGLINGISDPACNGTGIEPVGFGPHDQNKWNIRYIVEVADNLKDQMDVLDTKMDTMDNHLDAIEAKIDQLLP